MVNLQQPFLEGYLVEAAAREPLVQIRWGSRVTAVAPGSDGVVVTIDTPEGSYALACDWLVGAGGANNGFLLFFDLRANKVLRQEKVNVHLYSAALNDAGDRLFAAGFGKLLVYEMKA